MLGYIAIEKVALFKNKQLLDLFLSGLHRICAVHLSGVKSTQTREMKRGNKKRNENRLFQGLSLKQAIGQCVFHSN